MTQIPPAKPRPKASPAVRAVVDYGGLVVFVLAYFLFHKDIVKATWGLMDELHKIIRVVKKVDPEAPQETLLVLDATVGRNALAQENIFGNQIGVSGIVMTKLDGTARGGVLVPVAQASDSPIKLIGVGEQIDDLQPFDPRAFARSLVGLSEPVA